MPRLSAATFITASSRIITISSVKLTQTDIAATFNATADKIAYHNNTLQITRAILALSDSFGNTVIAHRIENLE
jgi:imidazole glycerol phosphate synthase subunit HisF